MEIYDFSAADIDQMVILLEIFWTNRNFGINVNGDKGKQLFSAVELKFHMSCFVCTPRGTPRCCAATKVAIQIYNLLS